MRERHITYRFHNPNPGTVMEDYIREIIIANGVKDISSALESETQQERETDLENEFEL